VCRIGIGFWSPIATLGSYRYDEGGWVLVFKGHAVFAILAPYALVLVFLWLKAAALAS